MQTRISCIDSIFITDQHGKDVCVLLTRFSDHVYDLNWHHCLLMKHPFYWKLKNKFVFTCNWIQVTVAIHIPGGFYRSLFWFLDARARVFDNRKHGLSKIRKIEDIWGLRGLTPLEKDGWTLLAMPEGPGAVFCLKICGFSFKSQASILRLSHLPHVAGFSSILFPPFNLTSLAHRSWARLDVWRRTHGQGQVKDDHRDLQFREGQGSLPRTQHLLAHQ